MIILEENLVKINFSSLKNPCIFFENQIDYDGYTKML